MCFLDEDDDIFKPPKLTDEDFTPFGSRGGLFSGGTGLFDDEEVRRLETIEMQCVCVPFRNKTKDPDKFSPLEGREGKHFVAW